MLVFSSCKINLGLHIVEKRSDGFHNIETVFYPLSWCDAIEVLESTDNQQFKINFSGISIPGDSKDNILVKAYDLVKKDHALPAIRVHLFKNVSMGAGLGGGSANAVNFIHLLDKKFDLKIAASKKMEYAKQLGSDCAFFVEKKAVLAKEKGDVFEPVKIDLSNYYILVVYPNVHSDTKMAYAGVMPKKPLQNIKTIIETKPIEQWKGNLTNDFENSVFKQLPQLKILKEDLYRSGAIYASMSGSGSAVFGIFKQKPTIDLKNYTVFLQEPHSKV
jgi:4-diphosphocytidyl-2-C-methyl-D-erythritol kinase